MNTTRSAPTPTPSTPAGWWQVALFCAMAGGLGWGIRGQYGHETGAMIAGLLVSLTATILLAPKANPLATAKAVAIGTIAIGIGGSMTYGQTVGLTHDRELVGNWAALRWGMLGLSIKGALWIGFFGTFLGLGLGGIRYRTREFIGLYLSLLGLCWIGIQTLNEPYNPAQRVLPSIYFSDDWRWEPTATLKPRREVWGGLLFALVGLLAYTRFVRGDRLAWRLGAWAMLGGAVGFPLGQSLQAFHAWNLPTFQHEPWKQIDSVINWWNFMETTFGATMGAAVGLGLWFNRNLITPSEPSTDPNSPPNASTLQTTLALELATLVVHTTLLVLEEFSSIDFASTLYDFGILLAFLPLIMVLRGRYWPFWIMLPITALPIAGKTFRQLALESHTASTALGACLYLVLPMLPTSWAALRITAKVQSRSIDTAEGFARPCLAIAAWLYFGLNFAFFRFPWPWEPWTARTPNAIIYTLCLIGLSWVALRTHSTKNHTHPEPPT